MSKLDDLFQKNREWADSVHTSDPDFFQKLADQQNPEYLWIGCSDSRVPANQIVGFLIDPKIVEQMCYCNMQWLVRFANITIEQPL